MLGKNEEISQNTSHLCFITHAHAPRKDRGGSDQRAVCSLRCDQGLGLAMRTILVELVKPPFVGLWRKPTPNGVNEKSSVLFQISGSN